MTAVITGWRWAVIDAPAPDLGQTCSDSPSPSVLFVSGLAVLPIVGAALRGHDLMSAAIEAEVSRSGTGSESSRLPTGPCASRSSMPEGCSRARSIAREVQEIWALEDVSFDVAKGRYSA